MILPIVAYGTPVLKRVAADIDKDYPELDKLLANMWETMYNASGVGLAAPQVGLGIRIFLVDTVQMFEGKTEEETKGEVGIKKAFINAEIIDRTGEEWSYNEGCLSIPGINEDVFRPETITIRYVDENFVEQEETYDKLAARVIQHEYDHIEGILFTDHLPSLRKRLLKRRLDKLTKGEVDHHYRMTFPKSKKKR